MEDSLYSSSKIEVRESSVHGYGVFATADLSSGELTEECYYLPLSDKFTDMDEGLKDYVFANNALSVMRSSSAVVLGYGMIYNHSEQANVAYKENKKRRVFAFSALREVKCGEELLIDYGPRSYSTLRL